MYTRRTAPSRRSSAHSTSSASPSSSPTSQRPRLLRSSVTEPSITPLSSNDVQASRLSHRSPHTAADLLHKMAYYQPGTYEAEAIKSEPMTIENRVACVENSTPEGSFNGCYFSFPSFENWESTQEESEKTDGNP
ncbi:uncharacterized protein F5Z01DRAFT_193266 [Emericellopsis atlantica]|uniref:Uncharacterized protein n=1 Tax=Emericellopsis atlantica TaxID=2614577 RepID=A0A9P7ZU71_9HYPO|nr:uncharacterized protein F5Z01DRAFT_193266 [Emericellopsis atlantica]KAG9258340.1 hypothetical protein F5Z01DRAFT_193266 [Emericellopsis atlantica]